MTRWSTIERDIRREGGRLIAGVDEVGRGSLAGPVVACAAIMPPDARAIPGVDDSKQLTSKQREKLAARILERAVDVRIAAASSREIDRINIYHASVLAMRRALGKLRVTADHVLVDGRPIRSLGVPHRAIVHGDARCFSIACASIVAKVTRDRLMALLAKRYPAFHWERNCGYTTPAHVVALVEHGVTPHHRRSFVVKALTADLADVEGAHGTVDLDTLADVVSDELQLPNAPLAADESSSDGTALETQITSDLQLEIDSALDDSGARDGLC